MGDHRRGTVVLWGAGLLALMAGCGGGGGGGIPAFNSFAGIAVEDLDGDGLVDIAAAYARVEGAPPHPGFVRVWRHSQAPPGTFVWVGDQSVGADPAELIAADLDRDGVIDLVVRSATLAADGPAVDIVSLLFGDAAAPGEFLSAMDLRIGARIDTVAVHDLDDDGWPDIAVAIYGATQGIVVLWQDPDAPGEFLAPEPLVTGSAFDLVVGDMNDDNHPDLVFRAGDTVLLAPRDRVSPRSFGSPVPIAVGHNVTAIAVIDLESDGLEDLVVGNRETLDFGTPGYLLVFRADPQVAGTWLAPLRYETTAHASAIAFGDMNGDGFVDTVAGEPRGILPSNDVVEVFFQEPQRPGHLRAAVTNAVAPATAFHIALGDFDGDRRLDVAADGDDGIALLFQDPQRPGTLGSARLLR